MSWVRQDVVPRSGRAEVIGCQGGRGVAAEGGLADDDEALPGDEQVFTAGAGVAEALAHLEAGHPLPEPPVPSHALPSPPPAPPAPLPPPAPSSCWDWAHASHSGCAVLQACPPASIC